MKRFNSFFRKTLLFLLVFITMSADLVNHSLFQNLPKMLTIGDSISFQYRKFLETNLMGKVDMHWLGKAQKQKINGGDTKRSIKKINNTILTIR